MYYWYKTPSYTPSIVVYAYAYPSFVQRDCQAVSCHASREKVIVEGATWASLTPRSEILEDAEIVHINKDDFMDTVYNDMTIAGKFIKLITNNVREKEERLLHLAYDSLRKRVAKALVDITNKFNSEPNAVQQIDISREDIAQYVGTATESLIRTLSDFKSEKLIEIKEGKIRIINYEKLKNLLY